MLTVADVRTGWLGVRCPHCRRLTTDVALVVASKRCPHCGARVVADPGPPADADPPDPLPQVTEFAAAADHYSALSGVLAAFAVPGWLGSCCLSAAFAERVGNPWLTLGLWAWGVAGVPLVASIAQVLLTRRERADERVVCWACERLMTIARDAVRLTGCCPHCGVAVADVAAPESVGPRPSGLTLRLRLDRWAVVYRRVLVGAVVWCLGCAGGAMADYEMRMADDPTFRMLRIIGDREADRRVNRLLRFWGGLATVGVGGAVAAYRLRWRPRLGGFCVGCGEGLRAADLVIASGRCPHCRRRVVAEEPPESGPC